MIQIVRTLPSQHMFCAFYQHTLKSHVCYDTTNFVGINQTGVTEYLRFLSEIIFNLTTHTSYFFAETIFICQWRKTVRIRFTQEFTTSCIIQFMQQFNYRRSMNFQLFQGNSRNRQSNLKRSAIFLGHFNQRFQRRNIRTFSYFINSLFIGIIIIIIMIGTYFEETITFQMYDLMYFKVKTDCFHNDSDFYYLP